MSAWVVRLTMPGDQRDGPFHHYALIEKVSDIAGIANIDKATEIHIIRAEGRNAAEIIYKNVTGTR